MFLPLGITDSASSERMEEGGGRPLPAPATNALLNFSVRRRSTVGAPFPRVSLELFFSLHGRTARHVSLQAGVPERGPLPSRSESVPYLSLLRTAQAFEVPRLQHRRLERLGAESVGIRRPINICPPLEPRLVEGGPFEDLLAFRGLEATEGFGKCSVVPECHVIDAELGFGDDAQLIFAIE